MKSYPGLKTRQLMARNGNLETEPLIFQHDCRKDYFHCYQMWNEMDKLYLNFTWFECDDGDEYSREKNIEISFCPFCGFQIEI